MPPNAHESSTNYSHIPPPLAPQLLHNPALALHTANGATSVIPGHIDVSPPVGYQNKSLGSGYNYVCNTFVPVGVDRSEMTLGDITPNSEFVSSSIQFLTSGGATASVKDSNLGTVKATYVYWSKDDEPVGGAGWYFLSDSSATYNQNGRAIAAGESFCVDRDSGESGATITIPSAL